MKRILLLLLLADSLMVFSQNVVQSRTASYFTQVYKITSDEANKLIKNKVVDESFFHDWVLAYPTDSTFKSELPTGHYIHVRSASDELEIEWESVNNLSMKILNNSRDLLLIFQDLQGKEMDQIHAQIKGKRVSFDTKLQVYRISKTNRQGIVEAEFAGHVNFFEIHRSYNNTLPARFKRRVLYTFGVRHVLSPFRYTHYLVRALMRSDYVQPPGIYYRVQRWFEPKDFEGYLAINKPMYKPGDTLRMKAFITKKKGQPVKRNLDVYVRGYSPHFNKKIAAVSPYRDGAYDFSFVLNDSLKLTLDKSYSIYLQDKRNNNYPDASFSYEHYELNKNFYSLTNLEDKGKESPAILLLKGTDSNDLPLYDVRAEIFVQPKKVVDFYEKEIFVKDTLWFHQLKLDPLGDTRVPLPDSIFVKGKYDYEVVVAFINTENERQTKTLSLVYDAIEKALITCENDSISFSHSLFGQYEVVALTDRGKEIFTHHVTLPHQEKIDHNANSYELRFQNKVVGYKLMNIINEGIELMASRTKDSLVLTLQNPRKLLVRYQLFKNNNMIEEGYSSRWSLKRRTHVNDRYYVSMQYIWAGEAKEQNYDLPFEKKPLQIQVDHPLVVSPGQTVDVSINVKDAFGNPVKDADVTAYAITKKFIEGQDVTVPNFERLKNRKAFNSFSEKIIPNKNITQKLNYDFWKYKLGLDSIQFYSFLYPENGLFTQEIVTQDSLTQIAPYVVQNGVIQPVYYIYFNDELKYYYEVETLEPYSFLVEREVYYISIRLRDRLISLPKLPVEKGKKLIISIDLDNLPEGVLAYEKSVKLEEDEIKKIRPHFLWIKRSEDQRNAYLQQGKNVHVFNSAKYNYGYDSEMAGPFFPGQVKFQSLIDLSFSFKPNMVYTFQSGLIDRETHVNDFSCKLPWLTRKASLQDEVLTEKSIQESWKIPQLKTIYRFRKYPDTQTTSKRIGCLTIRRIVKEKDSPERLATFLINLDQPDEYYIFPPEQSTFSPLVPGMYQCVIVYEDGRYIKPLPVKVNPYGTVFYEISDAGILPSDTFSIEIIKRIKEWSLKSTYVEQDRMQEMQNLRQLYYQESVDATNYSGGRWVMGVVTTSGDGSAIPGVNVIVKGTTIGTVSNADGFYRIYVPYGNSLVYSFIGFMTSEVSLGSRTSADVQLSMDVQQLSEVVVVGYGVTKEKKSLSYSVSNVLAGRMAGIVVNGMPGSADSVSIRIRGMSTLQSERKPLVIIDGMLKKIEDIDPKQITAIEILNEDAAIALYGSRASDGIILISTKPGTTRVQLLQTKFPSVSPMISLNESVLGSSLRKNFRDYAFWQPALSTDRNGIASFKVTYPDDITGWNIHALGMAGKKRTGISDLNVQSFKPLVAQLFLPNFLIEGDTARAIGKITNYSTDSLSIDRSFTMNQSAKVSGKLILTNSHIDSITMVGDGDSLLVKYEIEYHNYQDGELRKIPVLPLGSDEVKGIFAAIPNDSTFQVEVNPASTVTIFAQADMLDVLLDEINILKAYPYECNEQLASKLKALLAEKTIRQFKDEKFIHDKWVEKIIKKLTINQSKEGSWSWWGTQGGNMWISIHIAEALRWAGKMGYNMQYDRRGLMEYFMFPRNEFGSVVNHLKAWIFLSAQGEKLIIKPLIDSLNKNNQLKDDYHRLLSMRLLQLQGDTIDWNWIESGKQETLKGNIYWGEEKESIWNNDTDNSLLVYQLKEHQQSDHSDLQRIRNYFLERRKRGWRNTYESARIIEVILPSLQPSAKSQSPKLVLSGDVNATINTFPFQREVRGIKNITVYKTGGDPVYFTVYEKKWNPNPIKVGEDFRIETSFSESGKLKAGKPAELTVRLEVKKDAEYVMINVPIPAGCSYTIKQQSRSHGEVHREYDIHETRIYCERLRAGKYEYKISFTPRYQGKYHVNPAKAEWMYFPVAFGRDELKKVMIE